MGERSVRRQRGRLDAGASRSCGSRSVCAGFARSRGIMALRVSLVGYRVAEGGLLCNGRRQGPFQTTARVSSLLRSLRARITAALIADSIPAPQQHSETSSIGCCDGSIGLASQEGRDLENFFLDRIANSGGASAPIEASRSRRARIFRSRVCWSNFGGAGRRAEQRTR